MHRDRLKLVGLASVVRHGMGARGNCPRVQCASGPVKPHGSRRAWLAQGIVSVRARRKLVKFQTAGDTALLERVFGSK